MWTRHFMLVENNNLNSDNDRRFHYENAKENNKKCGDLSLFRFLRKS